MRSSGRKRSYHTLLRLRQIAMAEARVERLRARLAELNRRLEENRKKIKFGDVMKILETYLRRRYKEQQDDLLRLGSSAPSFVLELLDSVAAVNGSDDLWDLIVEYERDNYIDDESDDEDNNVETNQIS